MTPTTFLVSKGNKIIKLFVCLITLPASCFIVHAQNKPDEIVKKLRDNNPALYSAFKGSFSVSENGAATYDLPFNPTPGIGGMTPQISISYNSNNSSSLLGEGWALNGFSLISRSGSIQAIDKYTQPVTFDESDNLQLDGQRLIPTSKDMHGKNGCVYFCENNSFKRITIARDPDNSLNGIQYFKVETKDGLEYYYGNLDGVTLTSLGLNNIAATLPDNSLKGIIRTTTAINQNNPFLWLCTLILDKNKNWIYFKYQMRQNYYAPEEVLYGGNGGTAIGSIKFFYYWQDRQPGGRQNPWGWENTKYVKGEKVTIDKPLEKIVCTYFPGGSAATKNVKTYNLDYVMDPESQKLQLRYIYQSCTGNIPGNKDYNKIITDTSNRIVFDWEKADKKAVFDEAIVTKEDIKLEEDYKIAIADFNGDGFPDKLMYKNFGDKVVFVLSVNKRNGVFDNHFIIDTVRTAIDKDAKSFTGDFNADGKNDLVFITHNNKIGYILYLATVNGNAQFSGFQENKAATSIDVQGVPAKSIKYGIGDLNSDGYTDVMVYYLKDNLLNFQNILFFKDTSSITSKKTVDQGGIPNDAYASELTDINGDGLADLLFTWTTTGGWFIRSFISTDSRSLGLTGVDNTINSAIKSTNYISAIIKLPPDLSYADILSKVASGEISIDSLSKLTGVEQTVVAGDYSRFGNIMYGDVNKDGNVDLIISNCDLTGWSCYTALGKGDGTFSFSGESKITGKIKFWYNQKSSFGDFNGDGNLDIIVQTTNAQGWQKLIAYGDGKGSFSLEKDDGAVETMVRKDFSYSQRYFTDFVLPYCYSIMFGLYRIFDDGRIKKLIDCNVVQHECFMKNIRLIFPVETGFYPDGVIRYYQNPMLDPTSNFVPQNLNFENNVKRIIDCGYWGDSVVPNPSGPPGYCPGPYKLFTKIVYGDYWQPYVVDLNGDGLSDLLLTYPLQIPSDTALKMSKNELEEGVFSFAVMNQQHKNGFLTSIRHSNKSRIVIRYASILQGQEPSGPVQVNYPNLVCTAPLYAVSETGITNGVTQDSLNKTSYKYIDGIVSMNGRGFLGFRRAEAINMLTNNRTIKEFWMQEKFLAKGLLPMRSVKIFVNGTTNAISEDNYDYTFFSQYDSSIFNIYTSEKSSVSYDLMGVQTSYSKSNFAYDGFGNLTASTLKRGLANDEITQTVKNQYLESTDSDWIDKWILGRLSQTEITTTRNGICLTRMSQFNYNADNGQLIREVADVNVNEASLTKEYVLNKYGNIDSSIVYPTFDKQDKMTKYTVTKFTPDNRFVLKSVDPSGYETNNIYDPCQGLLLASSYGEKENRTKIQPDEFGRFQQTTSPDGMQASIEYRICKNCILPNAAVFSIETNTVTNLPVITFYDNSGHLIRKINFDFKQRAIISENEYDQSGNLISTSAPYFRNATPRFTRNYYDILNRLIKTMLPDSSITQIKYNGLTQQLINDKGQKSLSVRNILGEVVRTTDDNGNFVSYGYDLFSRTAFIVDKSNARFEMKYDINGNRIYYLNPNFKKAETIKYDAFGRKIESIDPNQYQKLFEYDKLDRITKIYANRPGFNHLIEYAYIMPGDPETGKGKLKSISSNSDDHAFNELFTYNASGQMETHTFLVKNNSWLFDSRIPTKNTLKYTYKYDKGQVKTITYPFTGTKADKLVNVNYNYTNGTASGVSLEMGGKVIPVWQLLETNAMGLTTQSRMGDSVSSISVYDSIISTLSQTAYYKGNLPVAGMNYSYDRLGNLVFRQNLLDSLLNDSIYYDNLNRVAAVKTGAYQVKVDYTDNGDITRKRFGDEFQFNFGYEPGTNKINTVRSVDPKTQRELASRRMTYDNYGNNNEAFPFLIKYKGDQIEYNQYNLPYRTGGSLFQYSYDGTKSAIFNSYEKTGIALLGKLSEYYYDFDNNYLQYQKINILVEGKTIGSYYTNNGKFDFYLKDATNTVIAIADEKGTLKKKFAYDIWGLQRDAATWKYHLSEYKNANSDPRNKSFLNNVSFDSYGLVDMGARLYNPISGRFVSVDPVLSNAISGTQFLNSYAYGYNNPTVFVDANGRFPWVILAIAIYAGASASGGSFLPWQWNDNWWKGALVGGLCVAGGYFAAPALFTAGATVTPTAAFVGGATMGFTGGFVSTLVNGGTFAQALETGFVGGVVGGLGGVVTFGANSLFTENPAFLSQNYIGRASVQGINEGISSEVMGGSFEHGFLAGSFNSMATPLSHLSGTSEDSRILISAMIGGTTSTLGGGKFANGAFTGAMMQIYHEGVDNRASLAVTESTGTSLTASEGNKHYKLIDNLEFQSDLDINPIFKENIAQDNYRVTSTYRTSSRNHEFWGGVDMVRTGGNAFEYTAYAQKLSQNLQIFCQYEQVNFIGNAKFQIDTRFYLGKPMFPAVKINPDHPATGSHVHCDLRPR